MIANRRLAGAAMVIAFFTSTSVRAADVNGVWIANDGQARIKLEPCGSNLCGTIVWLLEPRDPDTGQPKLDKNNPDNSMRVRPILGMHLLDVKPEREGQWRGSIYNGQNGQTYNVTIRAEAATLKVQGCVLGGLICSTQTWTRFVG